MHWPLFSGLHHSPDVKLRGCPLPPLFIPPCPMSSQPVPYWRRFDGYTCWHSRPRLCSASFAVLHVSAVNFWPSESSDAARCRRSRAIPAIFAPHPLFFRLLLQTKHLFNSTLGPPLRHAWVALGPPLGHPRATQSQSQSAEGRKPLQVPNTKYRPSAAGSLCFQRSRPQDTLQPKTEYHNLPFIRPSVNSEKESIGGKRAGSSASTLTKLWKPRESYILNG